MRSKRSEVAGGRCISRVADPGCGSGRMPTCIVKSCNFSWKYRNPRTALHNFPGNLAAIKAWLLAITQATEQEFGNLDELSQTILVGRSKGRYRMCSQHFTVDSFCQRGMLISLKKEAVPTVFPDQKANELKAWRRRNSHSRGKKLLLPEPAQEGVCAGGVPTSVMGLPLRVIKLEGNDSVPPDNPHGDIYGHRFRWSSDRNGGEVLPPRKKTRTLGTNTEFFPGQKHKATLTDKSIGMRNQEVQTENGKDHQQPHGRQQEDESRLAGYSSVKQERETKEERSGGLGIKDLARVENLRTSRWSGPGSKNKYMVFDSCLNGLLVYCRCLAYDSCHGSVVKFNKVFVGSTVFVKAECSNGHQFQMWDNQR